MLTCGVGEVGLLSGSLRESSRKITDAKCKKMAVFCDVQQKLAMLEERTVGWVVGIAVWKTRGYSSEVAKHAWQRNLAFRI
jgi:hypothetical protein